MRFGHTLVTAFGQKRDAQCSRTSSDSEINQQNITNPNQIRTCNSYWEPVEHLKNGGFEELILGLSSQPAEAEDEKIVEDLRGNLFGPLEFTRRDLMAINVQRGRDNGLPDYLTARKYLGLNKREYNNFEDLSKDLWYTVKDNKVLTSFA